MTSTRKFYRRVFKVEVLSEEPIPEPESLENVHYWITDGDCSGDVTTVIDEVVDGQRMAELLQAQASDPGFFCLDAEGNDIDTYGEAFEKGNL